MPTDDRWTAPVTFRTGDLLIGTASCATQIEGGDRNNSWFDWAQTPGHIRDGSTPERATDHWNRWREDNALMADLGLQIARVGVEWARIEPSPDVWDDAVLARYREEIEDLVGRGIRPMVTLHHFTNPSWFEAMGAWESDEAPYLFLRFARRVVSALGDVVTDWCTINEPNVYAVGGYLFGEFPPGRKNALASVQRVLRQMAIAHCRAYHLVHELCPGAKVGFAHHLRVFDALKDRNPIHRTMARTNEYLFQGAITEAFLGGDFPKVLGGQPEDVTPGPHYDYLGINYYSRTAVSKMEDGTFPGSPVNDLGWEIYPEGLVRVAKRLHAAYPGPIWVTENGTADNEERFRSRYLHDHLAAMVTSGLPFERYYHWCFVDNWEWAEGEVPRFGIVGLDYETQVRTVKPSGRFLARVIAEGGVSEATHAEFVAPQSYAVDPTPQPRG